MKRRLLDEASFRAPSCHFRHIAFHSLSLCTLRVTTRWFVLASLEDKPREAGPLFTAVSLGVQ